MKRSFFVLAGAAGLAVLSCTAGADVTNFCRVTISPSFSGGSGPYDHIESFPGTISLMGSATGGFSSSGSAATHVEYGSSVMNSVADGSLNAGGAANIHDVLTITAPGVPAGTTGTLRYTVRVSGALSATSGASASSWSFQSFLGGSAYDMTHSGGLRGPDINPSGPYGEAFGDFSSTVSFQYGSPRPLDIECHGIAQAAFGASGAGHCSVGNLHFDWRGISSVTANGSPISNFTVSSQTGTHYAGPFSPCGSADFNCDGDIGTDADIEAFFACLSGSCPPPPCTNNADFNADGDVGTDADIESFFRVLSGGPC